LKSLCSEPSDLDRLLNEDFINILTWLELSKAEEEIQEIITEQYKNKNKMK
jgi:hypothetical protein